MKECEDVLLKICHFCKILKEYFDNSWKSFWIACCKGSIESDLKSAFKSIEMSRRLVNERHSYFTCGALVEMRKENNDKIDNLENHLKVLLQLHKTSNQNDESQKNQTKQEFEDKFNRERKKYMEDLKLLKEKIQQKAAEDHDKMESAVNAQLAQMDLQINREYVRTANEEDRSLSLSRESSTTASELLVTTEKLARLENSVSPLNKEISKYRKQNECLKNELTKERDDKYFQDKIMQLQRELIERTLMVNSRSEELKRKNEELEEVKDNFNKLESEYLEQSRPSYIASIDLSSKVFFILTKDKSRCLQYFGVDSDRGFLTPWDNASAQTWKFDGNGRIASDDRRYLHADEANALVLRESGIDATC